jgi:hypothetical protein
VVPPALTYRTRLRREGAALAAVGLGASVALLVLEPDAASGPGSTVGQLAVVAALLAWLGPRGVRAAIARAEEIGGPGVPPATGEPTPLWHLPLVVAALAAPLLLAGAPDAALRVTGGSALVGAAQAVLLVRVVAGHERRLGRVFVRLPGSRILRGTRLGWAPAAARAPTRRPAPSSRRPPGAFRDEPA